MAAPSSAPLEPDLAARLEAIVRANLRLMDVLRTARALDLPDWLIVSGAIYQTVWNHLTGRDPNYGLKDYDLAYYDAGDISYEAEDAVIKRGAAAFAPEVSALVEIRNQARVHLWYEDHFGEPYAPLTNSTEALSRFVAPGFAVGVRLMADNRLKVQAPFGLADLFALRLRPNPHRVTLGFAPISSKVRERWPEVTIVTDAATYAKFSGALDAIVREYDLETHIKQG